MSSFSSSSSLPLPSYSYHLLNTFWVHGPVLGVIDLSHMIIIMAMQCRNYHHTQAKKKSEARFREIKKHSQDCVASKRGSQDLNLMAWGLYLCCSLSFGYVLRPACFLEYLLIVLLLSSPLSMNMQVVNNPETIFRDAFQFYRSVQNSLFRKASYRRSCH